MVFKLSLSVLSRASYACPPPYTGGKSSSLRVRQAGCQPIGRDGTTPQQVEGLGTESLPGPDSAIRLRASHSPWPAEVTVQAA